MPRPALCNVILAHLLLLAAFLVFFPHPARPAEAQNSQSDVADLHFDELYAAQGVLGMEFSAKVLALNGKRVRIKGFMAPPLKADEDFFVLTREPVALCPFCDSEADWPSDIVLAYLDKGESFVQHNEPIAAEGILEVGAATDQATGFVSLLRLAQSRVVRL